MEPSGGQPAIEARIDERREILWVEHLARDRYNGFPRSELLCSQRRLGIAANEVKNLLPLWIGDEELLGWRNEMVKSTEMLSASRA